MSSDSPRTLPRIFVSHSHQDNAYCREFVNGLRARSFAVWYDEHNLGWGALRQTIEREMPLCQHFVAIFSPAAVASEWVNAEIDAALELLRDGILRTLTFVVARPCTIPLLLRRWKRIEGPAGASVSATEAVARLGHIVAPLDTAHHPARSTTLDQQETSETVPSELTTPATTAPAARPQVISPRRITLPPDRLPKKLIEAGFAAYEKEGVAFVLPPLCPVPAGSFLMGSDPRRDPRRYPDEQPAHEIAVPVFQIARYPVTVAEYACFVRAGHKEPQLGWAGAGKALDWRTQLTRLSHPVTCVSWHDATAYAAWLAEQTREPWRLPTEAEWEKAARCDAALGTARVYPWGNAFDRSRCNTSESGIGTTTPVYAYPNGASPYGVLDMAGNVWEWTSTLFKRYPYNPYDDREDPNSTGNRVLRGGSWDYVSRYARTAYRFRIRSDLFLLDLNGFRLAVG